MTSYQSGIFAEGNAHHIYLEFRVDDDCTSLPNSDLVSDPFPDGEQVIGFGSTLLSRIDPGYAPDGLKPFETIRGMDDKVAPATQRDLFVWIQGSRRDECFLRALEWRDALGSVANIEQEEHGFVFRDSRDLTGFVDGSANPKGDKRQEAVIIPNGPHQGGTFVLGQRWIHNLSKFHAETVHNQEKIIGRTKVDSIEFEGDDQPPNSHVSRTDIKRGEEPVKIFRRSTPTGSVRDAGLYFLAFSAELWRFQYLLESMFGLTGDNIRDRLLSYSKPISGGFFFAPSRQHLIELFKG